MEIYEDLAELDYLIVPIGGGGLCSGSILATTEFSPRTKVIGVEPELASDAKQSLYMGSI
jgi:threonine dehydratase